MRSSILLSVLLASLAFAGCFGSADDHCADGHADADCPQNDPTHCDDMHDDTHCPQNNATHCDDMHDDTHCMTTNTTTTPTVPNVLPIIRIKVTDDAGNETLAVLPGMNLTFDASASADPDGNLNGMAIVLQDSNGTKVAPLMNADSGAFMTATFRLDFPGVVNVSVAALDDDGATNTSLFAVYVNHPQTGNPFTMKAAAPTSNAATCAGPTGDDIGDSSWYKEYAFEVLDGASYVVAEAIQGTFTMAICDPTGNPISASATGTVETTEGVNFTASLRYYVAVLSQPSASATAPHAGNQAVNVGVVVHYEPRPVAAEE